MPRYYLSATDAKGEHFTCIFNGIDKGTALRKQMPLSLDPERDYKILGRKQISFMKFVTRAIDLGDFGPARRLDELTTNEYGIHELPEGGFEKIALMHTVMGLD